MTTRNATRLLPRAADEAGAVAARLVDRLAVGAFALIQWPWLLRSLRGGSQAGKRALLDRLKLPADALPHLGSWKADVTFLSRLVDIVERDRPAIVVELGCGATSLIAARALSLNGGGRLHSFDQHGDFVSATRDWLGEYGLEAEMASVPLGTPPGRWPGAWYVLRGVPDRIDVLVIDGPPWTLHPFVRGAADTLFDRIPIGGTVLLDDAARPGERVIARRWRRRWPGFEFSLANDGTKGTLIGRRLR